MIIAFLENTDESKLQDIHFDLKRELEQKGDYYTSKCKIGKEFVELKFTINHDIY